MLAEAVQAAELAQCRVAFREDFASQKRLLAFAKQHSLRSLQSLYSPSVRWTASKFCNVLQMVRCLLALIDVYTAEMQ